MRPSKPSRIAFLFQSTHPVWGATYFSIPLFFGSDVSIHAPRVGCDTWRMPQGDHSIRFNPRTPCGVRLVGYFRYGISVAVSIHAPRVGCDVRAHVRCLPPPAFQSTHPVWGATQGETRMHKGRWFQSTHPVWGATRHRIMSFKVSSVSIHAPRVGCDIPWYRESLRPHSVSIHAPRVGCDMPGQVTSPKTTCFNPRTPCGVRQQPCLSWE